MTKTKMPVMGENGEAKSENLEAIQEQQANQKLKIMDELDAIKAPIMCTVILQPEAFEYRNREFWNAFAKKDQAVRESLTNYLNTKSKK